MILVDTAGARLPAWAIGGGKGGVGKSVLAVLLAAELARRGKRVLLYDGAHNQGNLHILLGVRPTATPEALLADEAEARDLLVPIGDRLVLLPAASGAESLYALGAIERARLHFHLTALYDGFDAVVVDAGPGIEGVMRVAAHRASRLVCVTLPEPAALTDTYALIKIVNAQVPHLPVDIAVNRVHDEDEGRAAFVKLRIAAQRFLRRDVGYLTSFTDDPRLGRAARRPGALLTYETAPAVELATRFEIDTTGGAPP